MRNELIEKFRRHATEQISEPYRENYAVLGKCLCKLKGKVADRLAQDVR